MTAFIKDTKTLKSGLGLMMLGMSLAACQPDASTGPVPAETIVRNEVRMVRIPFTVRPEEDGTETPSPYTLNSINLFLNSAGAGYGDVILMDAASVTPGRIAAIEDYLRQNGYVYGGILPLGDAPVKGSLTLVIERHIAVPPACGVWERQNDFNNNASPQLGCATAANLGAMVANPRDLVVGQSSRNSTTSAVGAIYTPPANNQGQNITLTLGGLPAQPRTATPPAPVQPGNQ